MMDELTLVQRIVVWVLPVIFAITVHEVAHGWVAKKYGDNTASVRPVNLKPYQAYRFVWNHYSSRAITNDGHRFYFGWAKPVPVDPRILKIHCVIWP